MNMKLSLLMIVAVLASSSAMAEDKAAKDPAAFQAMKDKHLAILQERVQIVQTHISCTQAAPDAAAMKACKEAAKKGHDVLEAKMKEAVAERKAKRDK